MDKISGYNPVNNTAGHVYAKSEGDMPNANEPYSPVTVIEGIKDVVDLSGKQTADKPKL